MCPPWCTLAPPGKYDWTCASLGPPASTTEMANRSVQPFLHSSRQKIPMLYNGRPFPPKLHHFPPSKIPVYMGSESPFNTWFLGTSRVHNTNGISISAQLTAQHPYTSQWVDPSPSKLSLYIRMSITIYYMIHWAHPSPQPKQYLNQFSTIFADGDRQTDRLIDRQTTTLSITIGCIYIRSTAMRPINKMFTCHCQMQQSRTTYT